MTLDFAIDLPHPPYDNMILLTFRSQYRKVVRDDTRTRYAEEMFFYFNNVFNKYCQKYKCNYFKKQYVRKGYV